MSTQGDGVLLYVQKYTEAKALLYFKFTQALASIQIYG